MNSEESVAALWLASSQLRAICSRMYGQHNTFAADELSFDLGQLEEKISDIEKLLEKSQSVVQMAEGSLK